ncbi:hypothetical protein C8T65DRAFT_746515, partial [Cerioporus squamosus]
MTTTLPTSTLVVKRGSFIAACYHPQPRTLTLIIVPVHRTILRRRTNLLPLQTVGSSPSRPRSSVIVYKRFLSWSLDADILDVPGVVDDIAASLVAQVSAHDLLVHTASSIAASCTKHPHFSTLAGRVFVASLHKVTDKTFSAWVERYATVSPSPFRPTFVDLVKRMATDIDDAVVHSRDFDFTYTSVRALAHTYLLRVDGRVIERPQYLYMRVALVAHAPDLNLVIRTYDALSRHLFTPASPVLFNAGTHSSNYASCFLYMPDTSTPLSQLNSTADLDTLWLADGGIGLSLGDIPARRTHPVFQPGIQPLLRVYDAHAEYTGVHRHKRPSAATIHLPVWHADYFSMLRLQLREKWSLFDPRDVPLLQTVFGDEFTRAYEEYEETVVPLERVDARDLWAVICRAQQESGTPFIMYQDTINAKNNHSHLGTIRTSNLCTEIVQFSSPTHTAVCTLASIAIARFVRPDRTYDFDSLHAVTRLAVLTTNGILDNSTYPNDNCTKSVADTRAIGIGVQGLADALMASELPFQSSGARQLNREIFESIYHAAYDTSCELAERDGPYPL